MEVPSECEEHEITLKEKQSLKKKSKQRDSRDETYKNKQNLTYRLFLNFHFYFKSRASLNYIFYNLIFYLFIFHFKSKCLDEIRLSCHWLARQGVNSVPTRWTLPERFSTSSTSSSNFLLIFKSFILFFFFKEVNQKKICKEIILSLGCFTENIFSISHKKL